MPPPQPLSNRPERSISELRQRVSCLKNEEGLLLERVERRKLSNQDARTEYKRLEQELIEAEQQVAEWQHQHRAV